MFVREVKPSIIKNSRKERTLALSIKTYEGTFTCSAPDGESKGKSEVPLYNKSGIEKSLSLLKAFCKTIIDTNFKIKKVEDLKLLTERIKRFESRFGHMGRSATYVLEGCFLKAAGADTNREVWQVINDDVNGGKKPKMPMPVGNCIGGGMHSKLVNRKKPDFQEFLLIPKEKTFSRAVTKNIRAYETARRLLKTRKVNDENAYETDKTNEEALTILSHVAKRYKLRTGVDIAASSFYRKGEYKYKNKELIRDKVDQADYIERLVKKFSIFYVEDPMQEEDFQGFKEISTTLLQKKSKTLVVGDDLTTTHPRLLRRAVESGAINAVIIKPNQVGSLLEVKQVVAYCKKKSIVTIFSHRSGETMDTIIADYAVGFGADFIKTGITGRERLIKLKRVIDIERSLK